MITTAVMVATRSFPRIAGSKYTEREEPFEARITREKDLVSLASSIALRFVIVVALIALGPGPTLADAPIPVWHIVDPVGDVSINADSLSVDVAAAEIDLTEAYLWEGGPYRAEFFLKELSADETILRTNATYLLVVRDIENEVLYVSAECEGVSCRFLVVHDSGKGTRIWPATGALDPQLGRVSVDISHWPLVMPISEIRASTILSLNLNEVSNLGGAVVWLRDSAPDSDWTFGASAICGGNIRGPCY